MRLLSVVIIVAATVGLTPAHATRDYPPRVSYIDGTASYEQAGTVDWDEATVNLPLLNGDRIYSQPDSRVELDLGRANFLRLGPETDLTVSDVTGRELRLQLHAGAVMLRVNDSEPFRIFTPAGAVVIKRKGLYRINVDPAGRVDVIVRKGRAEVETGSGDRTVKDGEILRLDASGRRDVVYGYYEDAFDQWSDRRDARFYTSRSAAYVGGVYYPGVWDLDYYGEWVYYPAYGRVWVPAVSVGWVPFRFGRWAYFSFGWTWISHEPWGWLPYHYGSWIYHHSRWCWVPGYFHTWSPAIVNFYWGDGYVGWTPRYWGGWGGTHNTIIINNNTTIINENHRRGLTVIRNQDFGRTRHVSNVVVDRPGRELTERMRVGLPAELRDPAVIRTRTAVARSEANPSGRRELASRGNSLTAGGSDRTTVGRPATATPGSADRGINRVTVGRPESRGTANPSDQPSRVRTPVERGQVTSGRERTPDTGSDTPSPARVERPSPRTYRTPAGDAPRNLNRPPATTARPGGGDTYRAPSNPPPRETPSRPSQTRPEGRSGDRPEMRSVEPAGPRSVTPSGPRSVTPAGPRSVEPSAPRSVVPSGPRAIEPSRSVEPPRPRTTEPSARSFEASPARSTFPRVIRSVSPGPSAERSYRSPAFSVRPAAPSVSRPSPSFSRSSPAVSRSAPAAPRSAPAVRSAPPARSAPSSGRPASSRPDRH
jgi:hypothetical protein